ncbi:cation efflux family-domain-containing protein [Kockovaella imperatae]|uniref:Cation efflux family-domain-containing protein n=1 Tax=Kockovaella imperatae TaxID=4999 RepID=A0A1Y1UB27_9TREE|nr:cation efflux family-domain-containing protein [Kockovaella imperatae]ORX35241.1 cation efflux family-domain-containing protein [Kockovaella imperatae]
MPPALESVQRRKSALSIRPSPKVPTAALLLCALACCICLPVSETRVEGHGHEILTVLAYWSWRLSETIRRGRKTAGEKKSVKSTHRHALSTICLGLGAVALVLSLAHAGPLRTLVFVGSLTFIPIASPTVNNWTRSIPGLAALVAIVVQQFLEDPFSLFPLLALGFTTLVVRWGQIGRGSKLDSRSRRIILLQSAGVSAVSLAVLYVLGWVSLPSTEHLSGRSTITHMLLACFLARYLPIGRLSLDGSIESPFTSPQQGPVVLVAVTAIQSLALPPTPSYLDFFAVIPLYLIGAWLASGVARRPSLGSRSYTPTQLATKARWTITGILPASWRPHFETILRTPTSSKIFYFLLLNLAYMAVQMVYGVLTNSLGLISDAIHMLFDCLGLAVGLWASVAATWKPDGRYTYGYSRVETLSGFANGSFLILISIFIIFEAIQRIMNPPEISTHQLLLVSTIGLLINLWGMYATGGHHHHGHSHGHSHEHVPLPVNEKKVDHRHESHQSHATREHSLAHAHSHGTGDSRHDHSKDRAHSRRHDHHDHDHENHDHDPHDLQSCHHSHDAHTHDHSHSHDHDHHGHGSHGHSHSHNMRGVFLHVLADTLGSVGVIVSTILIRFTGWTIFDPLASLFIAGLIMASVIPLVIDSAKVLCLDVGADVERDVRAALSELASVEGLSNYSTPRFWPTCEGEVNGSIHIQLAPSASSHDPSKGLSFTPRMARPGDTIYANSDKVVHRIERVLRNKIKGLRELVVQIEGSEERTFCSCMTGGT